MLSKEHLLQAANSIMQEKTMNKWKKKKKGNKLDGSLDGW